MKTQTIKDLFNLLKTALWQDKQYVKNIADVDWNCLYDLAKEQCVLALIADSFRFLTPKQYDSKGSMKWACYVIKQERENRIMNVSVGKVFGLLKEMGLSPILMKGQAFAANYPFPLHRQCGDIDVYFKKHNDCYKAVAWAKTKDKTAAISDDNKRDNQHFCFTLNRNIIELHYHLCLFENRTLQKRLQRIIDEEFYNNEPCFVDIEGEQTETVPPTLSVLHQIIHISKHLLAAGIGLRQLCDLALYLDKYHSVIDKEKLNAYLNELQLVNVTESIGYILVNKLGLKADLLPFKMNKQYADFLLNEVFKGGNFGRKNVTYREGKNRLQRKILSVFYFYKRCRRYKNLMPMEAKSFFLNKISLNIKLITKHHY